MRVLIILKIARMIQIILNSKRKITQLSFQSSVCLNIHIMQILLYYHVDHTREDGSATMTQMTKML